MRLDEITATDESVSLGDVLKGSQYIRLLRSLKRRANKGINTTRIKNRIIKAWRKGKKSRKHFDSLLKEYDLDLNELIEE